MAPRALSAKEKRACFKCGKIAEVRYRKEWYCGACLNPEPSTDYLTREREMVNGQWGVVNTEAWGKL